MDTKKTEVNTKTIQHLISGLADKPDLAQRLLKIVKLANEPTEAEKVRSADEVECLLVQEVRKLGKELKAQSGRTQMREKKS